MSNNDIIINIEDVNEDIKIQLESKEYSNLQSKEVNPSLTDQIVEADEGYDALKQVKVKGVALQVKSATPSTEQQSIVPDSQYLALEEVVVQAVDSSIDENIVSENIKSGIVILGVLGNYTPTLQTKTVHPSSNQQEITPDQNYEGLEKVTVEAMRLELFNITPRTYSQTLNPSPGYDALGRVKINAVTASIDSNIQPQNIVNGITILGVTGTYNRKDIISTNANSLQLGNAVTSPFRYSDVTGYTNNLAVTSTGKYAFQHCYDLDFVRLPLLTNLQEGMFGFCSSLETMDFSSVESIGNSCFDNCTAIQEIRLPVCTSLGRWCFHKCNGLTDVYLGYNGVCTCSADMFLDGVPNVVKFHVPNGLKSSYETATNWSTLVNDGIIEIIEDYA